VEATIGSVKAYRLRESEHYAIVIACIIKHKIANYK
jgi:hypothetical protein